MARLRGKLARLLALLALIAGLVGTVTPGFAAPMQPDMKMAMDCPHGGGHHDKKTGHQLPGMPECCIANVCAMSLALPAVPTGIALPVLGEATGYTLAAPLQPTGFVTAPLPHPPQSNA